MAGYQRPAATSRRVRQTDALGPTTSALPGESIPSVSVAVALSRSAWVRTLAGGLALYGLVTVATIATRDVNLVPSVLLLGAPLIPVTFVVYVFERLSITVAVGPHSRFASWWVAWSAWQPRLCSSTRRCAAWARCPCSW